MEFFKKIFDIFIYGTSQNTHKMKVKNTVVVFSRLHMLRDNKEVYEMLNFKTQDLFFLFFCYTSLKCIYLYFGISVI